MRENDVLFFNLHRRYINQARNYGGFLGIFMLAAFLNENGYESQAFAGQMVEGKHLIDEACSQQKVGMIGLYCDFDNVTENIFLSKYIKDTYSLPVIIGGPQAIALDKSFFQASKCDAVVRYEGELTVLELTENLLDGTGQIKDIKGIAFLENGEVKINPERELIEELDALPFKNDECFLVPEKRERSLSIMTGRGCPFHCTFCYEGAHTKKVRFRSVANVVAEIQQYIDRHPGLHELFILFSDDTFTLIPERVREICEAIKEWQKCMRIRWFCEAHIHTLYKQPEMIEYLADAKCHRVQLGIEAGTQRVLDAFRKGDTPEEIKEVVRKCAQAGIPQIFGNIILGAAFFSREVFEMDLAFAKELLHISQGTLELNAVSYWPLPQTEITNNPQMYNICICDYDFLTAEGDFSQVETEEFDRWQISEKVKFFRDEMKRTMGEMLRNREVPLDRVTGWFSDNWESSAWSMVLKENPLMYNYFEMLSTGEAGILAAYHEENWHVLHPMRVCGLDYIMTVSQGNIKIGNLCLDELDKILLPYCVGKLSVEKIVQMVNKELEGGSCYSFEQIMGRLQIYEKEFLVVFSMY